MKSAMSIALLCASFASLPMLTGCDADKSTTTKTDTVTHPNGATSTDQQKTTTDSNGNTTQTEVKKTTP